MPVLLFSRVQTYISIVAIRLTRTMLSKLTGLRRSVRERTGHSTGEQLSDFSFLVKSLLTETWRTQVLEGQIYPLVGIVNESFVKHHFNNPAAAVGRRVAQGAAGLLCC